MISNKNKLKIISNFWNNFQTVFVTDHNFFTYFLLKMYPSSYMNKAVSARHYS